MIEGIRIILLRLTIIEAGTVRTVTDSVALLQYTAGQRLTSPQCVQRHAVGVCHRAGIAGGLHSPLNLKAVNAGVPEVRKMLDHAEVFRIQNEGAPVFGYFHVFPRAGFLDQMVFPSAGLRTFAVVGVSSRQIIGKQASPGEGNAHRAVDKGLQAERRGAVFPDRADFFQAALPGKYTVSAPSS